MRALLSPAAGLAKLKTLALYYSPITDAGCAALAAALDIGTLPALEEFYLYGTSANEAMKDAATQVKSSRSTTLKLIFRRVSSFALKLIIDRPASTSAPHNRIQATAR